MLVRIVLGLLLAACPAVRASARTTAISGRSDYLIEVWDTDRGLPNYGVTSIVQTPDGYLWVGTYAALARFDGVHFKVVDHDTAPEFPSGAVTKVYVDRKGQLWAATEGGIICLQNGHWRLYPGPGGLPLSRAADFIEASDGRFRVKAGLGLFVLSGDHFEQQPIPPGIGYLRGLRDSHNDLWLTGSRYFGVFRRGDWTQVPLPEDFSTAGLLGAGAGRQGIWLASQSKIHKFQDGVWLPPTDSPEGVHFNGVVKFMDDSQGNLWVGDFVNGLFQYRKDGRLLQFTRAEGMPNPAIRWIFEDREQNIWVGTDGGGLVRLKPRMANMFDEAQGLNEIILDTVVQSSRGSLLAGTYGGGLVRFDPAANRFSLPLDPGPGKQALVLSVLEEADGTIWAGTYGQSLFRIRGRTVEQTPGTLLGGNTVKALFRDSRGAIWIGTDRGIAGFQDGRFQRYDPGPLTNGIGGFAEGRDGEIWAGGPTGLYRRRGDRFEKYLPPGATDFAPVDSVYAARDGALWIGVSKRGLFRLRGGELINFGSPQGLPDSRIGGMVEDDTGRLWVATDTQGLLAIPLASFEAVAAGKQVKLNMLWLKKEDGLATNQFRTGYQSAASKGQDGRLWFATLKGLAMVDPAKVRGNPVVPEVWIEAVGIGGRTIPIEGASKLEVPAGSRSLKFFFTATSFTAPERVRFQYRLDNLDSAWIDSAERSVSFGDLRPGDYRFHVRAANNDGLWNPDAASVQIHVDAFLWETWWFRLLAVVTVAVTVAGAAYGSQRKKLRGRTGELRQEQALRRDVERLQAVLKVSEERFSKAFNFSPAAMTIATRDEGRYLDVNQTFLDQTGYRREEVVGHLRSELVLWDDPSQLARFSETLQKEGRVHGLEIKIRDRQGQPRFQRLSSEVIELDGVSCILSVTDDVTERTRLEEQLGQARKLESVGRLAGGVAHDFNNMLTVINGYSELLLEQLKPEDPSRQRVGEIRRAGGRAADLTQQLLTFSRRQVIRPKPLRLNDPVRETEQILKRLLPENIEIVTRLDPLLGLVMADSGQIHQVLMNLALNARDAMPSGGTLVMETSNGICEDSYATSHPEAKAGPYVLLAMTDSGMGMDESVSSHIFEPFFTTKPVGAGTGLGLATVYGTVRQNGGWIWVYSEPGRGTTFKIYLPRLDDPLAADERAPFAGRSYQGSETVLLVEDQPDVRSLVREVLDGCGYRVLEAAHGAEALQVCARHSGPIHLLVTDVIMPGMTGDQLAERLKGTHPETKVLYMSGYTENAIVHGGILKPGIAYIPKPLAPEALAAKVREILG